MNLVKYGWNEKLAEHMQFVNKKDWMPGRVISEIKNHYRIITEDSVVLGHASGRMFYHSQSKSDLPVVGDWVLFQPESNPEAAVTIKEILPRSSLFVRKIPGRVMKEQPVAANVDVIFLITGLDDNYNLRRIERYLTLAWESGATPVILLNKKDLCEVTEDRLHEAEAIAMGVPVHTISALYKEGLSAVMPYLSEGKTGAMLGSSGVGKSTLLNALYGEEIQDVKEIGVIGKGQHTTRTRELFKLPDAGLLIDTPGMREIQLWNVDEGMETTFPDIEELADECRFGDCGHRVEPGCAVKAAVDSGNLEKDRYEHYIRLQDELEALESRQDKKAILERKAKEKRFGKLVKNMKKVEKKARGKF